MSPNVVYDRALLGDGGGLLGLGPDPTTTSSVNTDPLGVGGIFSTLFGESGTATSTSQTTTSTESTTSTTTSSSATTTSSTSTSTSSSTTSTSTTSTSTTSSSESSTTPVQTPTSPPATTYETTSNNHIFTITSVVTAAESSATPSQTTVALHQSFLENKSVSVPVLTIVGLIGLALILSIAAFLVRAVRKRRLHDEAIAWPDANDYGSVSGAPFFRPSNVGSATTGGGDRQAYARQDVEKGRTSMEKYGSDDSHGSGHGSTLVDHTAVGYKAAAYGYNQQQQQQQGYYNQQQYPQAAYGYGGYPAQPQSAYPAQQQNAYPVPTRTPAPQLHVITATPMDTSLLSGRASPTPQAFPSSSPTTDSPRNLTTPVVGPPRRTSLINSTATSPSEGPMRPQRKASTHARELDPSLPQLPVPSPLPDTFGSDSYVALTRSSGETFGGQEKTLVVANE